MPLNAIDPTSNQIQGANGILVQNQKGQSSIIFETRVPPGHRWVFRAQFHGDLMMPYLLRLRNEHGKFLHGRYDILAMDPAGAKLRYVLGSGALAKFGCGTLQVASLTDINHMVFYMADMELNEGDILQVKIESDHQLEPGQSYLCLQFLDNDLHELPNVHWGQQVPFGVAIMPVSAMQPVSSENVLMVQSSPGDPLYVSASSPLHTVTTPWQTAEEKRRARLEHVLGTHQVFIENPTKKKLVLTWWDTNMVFRESEHLYNFLCKFSGVSEQEAYGMVSLVFGDETLPAQSKPKAEDKPDPLGRQVVMAAEDDAVSVPLITSRCVKRPVQDEDE